MYNYNQVYYILGGVCMKLNQNIRRFIKKLINCKNILDKINKSIKLVLL